MLLEKHHEKLILGLEAERKIKVAANKPFLELAKLELLEIVRKARLKTGVKVTVDTAINRTLKLLKARVFLRTKAKLAFKKEKARQGLRNFVRKARVSIWEDCIKHLFNIGYSCERILDDAEYTLQIHPSKTSWYKGMLEVVATDTFLGSPLGVVKVHIPMPLQLLLYLKQELPLQNVYVDYHRCLNTLHTVCHRLRFGRVLESDDPRKRRLEDPAARVKGLGFGLKARGIFRTKKSMKKNFKNGRIVKHVVVRGFRTSQQEWEWRVRRRKLLPADYKLKTKRMSAAAKRKASQRLLDDGVEKDG